MRVCAERAFGMLKDIWRILLKMIDMHFKNVPKLVSTCIVSQNICIIFGEIKKMNECKKPQTTCTAAS